jgi:hypothetical protein
LRRVTRWAGLMLPMDSECECGRALGSEPAMVLEWRCCVVGRTLMGSWSAGGVSMGVGMGMGMSWAAW